MSRIFKNGFGDLPSKRLLQNMRLLRHDLTKVKCHINEGALECRYLAAAPDGFVCGFLDIVLSVRLATFDRLAQAGPCRDPFDETSDALPAETLPKTTGEERH